MRVGARYVQTDRCLTDDGWRCSVREMYYRRFDGSGARPRYNPTDAFVSQSRVSPQLAFGQMTPASVVAVSVSASP